MLSTKIVTDINEVPSTWIFENYLEIPKLIGQDVIIKSPFSRDSTPSFSIYYDKKSLIYKFKDFSTDRGGLGGHLVWYLIMRMNPKASISDALRLIVNDYNKYLKNNEYKSTIIKLHHKYKVTDYSVRDWNTDDAKYWSQFAISSKILEFLNIRALDKYVMQKITDTGIDEIAKTNPPYTYGYFKNNNELYKIYQPKIIEKKFIKVLSYIQGSDQLKFNKNTYFTLFTDIY